MGLELRRDRKTISRILLNSWGGLLVTSQSRDCGTKPGDRRIIF